MTTLMFEISFEVNKESDNNPIQEIGTKMAIQILLFPNEQRGKFIYGKLVAVGCIII
jgi:hypothetical protein